MLPLIRMDVHDMTRLSCFGAVLKGFNGAAVSWDLQEMAIRGDHSVRIDIDLSVSRAWYENGYFGVFGRCRW